MTPTFAPDRPDFYLDDPHAAFQDLRRRDPVHWYEAGGFWCVTRHADLQEVSRTPRVYSSAQGTQVFEIAQRREGIKLPDDPRPLIRMDPPAHNQYRKLVIQAFSLRRVQGLEPTIRAFVREIIDAVPLGERVNLVEGLAIPIPMLVIAELLGVPRSHYADFRRWSDAAIEAAGGGLSEESAASIAEFSGFLVEQIARCRANPGDDLISMLTRAEVEGQRLTDPELMIFLLLLLVAGNETTRNLISGGVHALLQHPGQLDDLRAEPSLIPNAVEEMLRWGSPVHAFVRCAVADATLGGREIAAGDFVVLLYGSANRDEEVFGDTAEHFDIRRPDAARHVAFGFGEHLCLGAPLARLEARIFFEELFARLPPFEADGPPERLSSVLVNGLLDLPVVFDVGAAVRASR